MVPLESARRLGVLVLQDVHRDEARAQFDFVRESDVCWHLRELPSCLVARPGWLNELCCSLTGRLLPATVSIFVGPRPQLLSGVVNWPIEADRPVSRH